MSTEFDGVHPYPVSAGRRQDPVSKARRKSAAKVASNTRWAKEPDRRAATQAARDAQLRRLEDEVDPDRVLDAAERERRVANLRSAQMTRLARKSADARATRRSA